MRVTTNGVSIYYEVRGKKGPALIMLHGNGEDHTIFDRAVDYLEQAFTVYLVDSRGQGQSSPPLDGEYHYADMADDLHDFIRKLGIEDPVICGFSDGGIVALLFAMEHPDVPSRLFVCGANTRPSMIKGMTLTRLLHGDEPLVRMMLTEPDIRPKDLARITCPVTVIAGSRDCIRRENTELIAASVQDGRLCIMKRADHSSYIAHSTRIVDPIFRDCGVDVDGIRVVDRFSRRSPLPLPDPAGPHVCEPQLQGHAGAGSAHHDGEPQEHSCDAHEQAEDRQDLHPADIGSDDDDGIGAEDEHLRHSHGHSEGHDVSEYVEHRDGEAHDEEDGGYPEDDRESGCGDARGVPSLAEDLHDGHRIGEESVGARDV